MGYIEGELFVEEIWPKRLGPAGLRARTGSMDFSDSWCIRVPTFSEELVGEDGGKLLRSQ